MLLTTGSGLYGIGLYGTGQEAEIRLESNHAMTSDDSTPATEPDSAGRELGTQQLTRTFVNPDALRNAESPRGRSPARGFGKGEPGNSHDRPSRNAHLEDGTNYESVALNSTPTVVGSRNTLGYSSSLAEATSRGRNFPSTTGPSRGSAFGNQHMEEANMQWGGGSRVGRGRSGSLGRRRSRSLGRRQSRSLSRTHAHTTASRSAGGDGWTERAEGRGARDGHSRQRYRRSRSPSHPKSSSHTARRDSPRRRSSPQRRRARSPSLRSSRGLPRSSSNRKRLRSESLRRSSSPPNRRGSPRRRGNSPRRGPQRSAELSGAHRSSHDSKGKPSGMREKTGSTRCDRGSPSPAAKARKVARERSIEGAEDEDATVNRGNSGRQEGYRGRQQDSGRVPSRNYRANSPAAGGVKAESYGAKAIHGVPKEVTRASQNGPRNVGAVPVGTRMIDPIIPLALGGAPIPPVAAVPGKRFLMAGGAGGGGGFTPSDDPPTKRFHATTGNGGEGYPMGNGEMPRGGWPRRDVGGIQGGGGLGPLAPNLAPAVLPPLSSLRPLPLPAGCAQGARLMIKGTHPAVPERRIHALASTFGIVGKIEVLEVSLVRRV